MRDVTHQGCAQWYCQEYFGVAANLVLANRLGLVLVDTRDWSSLQYQRPWTTQEARPSKLVR